MTIDAMKLFFAMLALGSQIGLVVFLGVSALPSRRSTYAALRPLAGWFAVAVSLTCMLGSLYLSEVANFRPCRLCWVQRGFMYPLVLITLVLASMGWRRGWWLPLVVSIVGGGVSVYHILIENGIVAESSSCEIDNPCSLKWVNEFGFMTIPTMALTGFLLIAASSVVILSRKPQS